MPKRFFIPSIIGLVSFVALSIGFLFLYYYPSREELRAIGDNLLTTSTKYVNGLDGQAVADEAESVSQAVGVMIDNHPNALPVSGISQAKIVYEAPVEGGLTRYLAIFDSRQAVDEVGPVRSARPYFLDWLQEYGRGLYLHSGGSPEALDLIKKRNIFSANEFFLGRYYWRSSGRQAPHNLYTSSDNWNQIIEQQHNKSGLAQRSLGEAGFAVDNGWRYSRLVGRTIGEKSEVKINFFPGYTVTWTYDAEALNYIRGVNGRPEKDKDGSSITARNILVQFTKVKEIDGDDKGRVEVATLGSGDAIILKKGAVVYGSWKKDSLTDRTRFFAADGAEVVLPPGNTWVEVVPKEIKISVEQ